MGISFLTVLTFYLPSDSGEKVKIITTIFFKYIELKVKEGRMDDNVYNIFAGLLYVSKAGG